MHMYVCSLSYLSSSLSHLPSTFRNTKMSHTSRLNTRPPHLETDQDLLQDQRDYFYASNPLPHLNQSLNPAKQHDHYISSRAPTTNSESPTSTFLPLITERNVSRKSRRRPRFQNPSTPSPFPLSSFVSNTSRSRFARISPSYSPSQTISTPLHPTSSSSDELQKRIESMSIEQIRAAQQEIYETLKPESIQILQKMWRRTHQHLPHNPSSTKSDEYLESTSSTNSCPRTRPRSEQSLSFPSVQGKEQCPHLDSVEPSKDPHTQLLVPINSYESDQEEKNKRMWMTDAEDLVQSQNEVDHLVQSTLEILGHVGEMRFGLTGDVLSAEDIQTLPTHLGLHHHGCSPARAGYTLSDVLVLMRSTVVIQRVMALRMFKSIVLLHREEIVAPLVKSGCLTSAFSEVRCEESYSAITAQSAYLEAVEVLVQGDPFFHEFDRVTDLYFGSNFYSPSFITSFSPVLKALADSDVIGTLLRIARGTALKSEYVPVAERALRMVDILIAAVPGAADKHLVQDRTSLCTLRNFATGVTGNDSSLFMFSCNLLAQLIISLGWRGGEVLERLKRDVIDDQFLHDVSSTIISLIDSDIAEITEDQVAIGRGVMRLSRGALTFQCGVESFAVLVHALCRLVRDDATATETYLGLEAYAHALFIQASSHEYDEYEEASRKNISREDYKRDNGNENGMVRHRLLQLIPLAISGTAFFLNATGHNDESRAAAGHFAATLFSLTSHPLPEEYRVRILNICSSSTNDMIRLSMDSPESARKIRNLSSLSHASARLLCRVKVNERFVEREVSRLTECANLERLHMQKLSTASASCVVANACAEWIGLYSKVTSSEKTAQASLKLLPYLIDGRVIVDLLSRTLLNVGVLRGLCSTISIADAENSAKTLLPLTMTELSSLREAQGESSSASEGITSQTDHLRRMSFEDICSLWIRHVDACESLFCVTNILFKSKLLEGTALFECLLLMPVANYSDSVFRFMFEVGQSCLDQGAPLISSASRTVLSSLSTEINSPIVDSVISLCDFLLSRGPSPSGIENPDFLSSILMTLMCGYDIDFTLRVSMWKRTVDDCGGATLYQNAIVLEGDGCVIGSRSDQALYDMLRVFSVSISEGFLHGERCPSAVRNTILERIGKALSTEKRPEDVLEVLSSCVRSRSSFLEGLSEMLLSSTVQETMANALNGFLQIVSSLS